MQIAADSGHIYIETRHPAYPHVKDFLISCCEPVSRTHHMQQYQLNSDSLSAASAEGTYSVDIIRTILQYFQLCGDSQQLPICLERYEALVRWADVEDDEDAEDVVERLRGLPFVAEMVRQHAEKSTASSFSSVKKNDEECAPRRTLKLSLQSNGPQVEADGLPTGSALLPLVALSRHDGDPTVAPPALSSFIEGLLQEEEQSERVSLVLQPRLRRFLPLATSTTSASSKPKSAGSGDEILGDELRYFLVSSSRPNLEQVVSVAKAYLQPILLGGTPRYIISDVDHGVEDSRAAPVEGTPRLLHRLFSPQLSWSSLMQEPSCATASRKRPRAGEPLSREAANGWSKDVKKTRVVFKCEVQPGKLRHVRECLSKSLGLRTDCVYDYQQDPTLHVERLSLAPNVRLRPYQVASLERFRRGNKAHQGIVVLPCGAGKTLTGIGAASIMRKTTIVMCINNMSVYQWKREFLRWTNLTEDEVTVCTAREKAMPGKVFITTYNMVIAGRDGATGATAAMSKEILAAMMGTPWGLLLLDEVHVAFAHHFQEVLNKIQYKCVLGLSATLLREDDKIADSRHLVGPKLYEANWLELTAAGFLAKVVCAEVQCPMAPSFHNEYLRAKISDLGSPTAGDRRRRRPGGLNRTARIMASCNPYKLWCTQALLDFHRSRSPVDKILIFCDYLADVRFYAHHLHLPFMDQRTSDAERANLLQYFQYSDTVNALILTRVGDVALDLPCASVIIQISGLGASRRQEAQRLGRILRPKPPSLDNTCAYFYTLVSQDTHEVQVSYRRQSWLRDQGFAYRVLHASTVLAELQRVRGMPCCIGAPQWWWQVPAEESAPATKAAASSARPRTLSLRQPSSAYSHVTEAATGIRWAPFSPEASQRMHAAFMRGKDGVELRRDLLLGSDPAYAAMMDAREIPTGELSWKVQFSSVDIPLSNGTVQLPEELMGTSAARRIKLGRIDDGGVRHWCLSEGSSCSAYALSTLLKSDDMHGDGEDAAMAEALLGE